MLKHVLIAMLMTAATTHPATAKMTVVASTTDIASIAQFVGGDLVEVSAIAKGTADPHFVEVLPSYMVKVKKARVYLRVGLDLDRWALPIIDGSRNSSLLVVDCSASIAPVNIPTGKVDASMGDIHPRGNPHYWLDPVNGVTMANTIATAFERADAANAAAYRANAERFAEEIKARQVAWNEKAKPLAGLEIITYHDAWPYFARAFGVVIAGFVEPLPGIEPTPSHTAELIELIKGKQIKIIGVEPYFSRRTPESIANATGARVIDLPPSVGGAPGADDYFQLFDVLLDRLLAGAK